MGPSRVSNSKLEHFLALVESVVHLLKNCLDFMKGGLFSLKASFSTASWCKFLDLVSQMPGAVIRKPLSLHFISAERAKSQINSSSLSAKQLSKWENNDLSR